MIRLLPTQLIIKKVFMDTIEIDIDARLVDVIQHIKLLKCRINQLNKDKQKCEEFIRRWFDHPEEGSIKYDFMDKKLTITTGYNYTFNKLSHGDYLLSDRRINPRFDPVKQVIKFELNKKTIRNCEEFGSPEDKLLMSSFVKATPKKLHITIVDMEASKNE